MAAFACSEHEQNAAVKLSRKHRISKSTIYRLGIYLAAQNIDKAIALHHGELDLPEVG